jgi:hypothetical protein
MSETTSQKVVNWARAQLGKQVRTGECWDLADSALNQAILDQWTRMPTMSGATRLQI